ncbi:MAG: DegT/DnrJ/EryC1/StrS family aminotransferase [Solirubrobacteraceae bacterium]
MTRIPFTRPFRTREEDHALAELIASGPVRRGARVLAFERAFAARVGAPHAVATTSHTAALELALHVAGVGPGDEVVVPSRPPSALADAVIRRGATAVFADIDPLTYNIHAGAVEWLITPRTTAIVPVHQLGLPVDMDPLVALAWHRGLAIIEDAASAVGATYRVRPVGSLGPITCFSLHASEVITTGKGGIITVRDASVAERLCRLRRSAIDVPEPARNGEPHIANEADSCRGQNAYMTDAQAGRGLCQLRLLDAILRVRRKRAERYTAALDGIHFVETPFEPDYARHTWQSYAVRVAPDAVGCNELMHRLRQDGVPTRPGLTPIDDKPRARAGTWLPSAEATAQDSLMLPLFPDMTDDQQDYVIERLAEHVTALAI